MNVTLAVPAVVVTVFDTLPYTNTYFFAVALYFRLAVAFNVTLDLPRMYCAMDALFVCEAAMATVGAA